MLIFVTNPGLQILATATWQRAATLLVTGDAVNLPSAPVAKVVHSPSTTLTIRQVIAVQCNAFRPWNDAAPDSYAPNAAILARDARLCAYCGSPAATVDHVQPASRGGGSTWQNLVACCAKCNAHKAARTPREAGMTLRVTPLVYNPWLTYQRQVYELVT
ncbi:HNH endonuclease [Gordonia sp. TBRC 11910]|uniref:HNH endonuclease n=1 Tax=Gordonia asplenii TaxID=2725283 RepID=A0A848KUH0_9ACTN|nr:HNH endonuclease [Gordonia asplenii]NMO01657.1 HNH endonuclease [Gordonia asplenii]